MSEMTFSLDSVLVGVVLLTMVLALALVFARNDLAHGSAGRLLLFVGLFVLPALSLLGGVDHSMHEATTTSFCLGSCHEMEIYGTSLHVDDSEVIPAVHFQNHLVDAKHACFTCHTNYTMFGDLKAKVTGLRHVYVHYLGEIPDDIKLYHPFPNDNCLSCHRGARSFQESKHHNKSDKPMEAILSGEISCTSAKCHDLIHVRDEMKDDWFEMWEPDGTGAKAAARSGDES